MQQLVSKGRAIGADFDAAAKDEEHEISTDVGRTSAGDPDGDVVDLMARPDDTGAERTAVHPSVPFSSTAAPKTLDEEPQARTVHGAVHGFEAGYAPYGVSDQGFQKWSWKNGHQRVASIQHPRQQTMRIRRPHLLSKRVDRLGTAKVLQLAGDIGWCHLQVQPNSQDLQESSCDVVFFPHQMQCLQPCSNQEIDWNTKQRGPERRPQSQRTLSNVLMLTSKFFQQDLAS